MSIPGDGLEILDGLDALEGDEPELEVGRHRDVGGECLRTPISALPPSPAVTVPPDATVRRAADLMRLRGAAALLVVERRKGHRVVGIFTQRDLVERALPVRAWASAPVSRFMTPDPESLRPWDPVAYAVNKMSVGGFRHVPIVNEGGQALGLLSAADVMDFVVELCPEEMLNLPPEPALALHPAPDGP